MAASKPGASAAAQTNTSDREIFATRIFDAPRALVWKMWTEPERISKWWRAKGFAISVAKLELRPAEYSTTA